jgi:hypothetical protein
MEKRVHKLNSYENCSCGQHGAEKLKPHLETVHAECVEWAPGPFHRKLNELNKQKQVFVKIATASRISLLASFNVACRIARCIKPLTHGECLVLVAAVHIVETVFGESHAKELQRIPLADITVGRTILAISESLCDQLQTSRFVFQVDETTDVVDMEHFITYVR